MDELQFQRIQQMYNHLWQNGYGDANWKRLANIVIERNKGGDNSLIDFGFGTAKAMRFFRNNGFYVEGVEISSYAIQLANQNGFRVYHVSVDNLESTFKGTFGIGFCNDVLEHLPEESVPRAIKEMAKVCHSKLYISVCPTISHNKSLDGKNLHLTVKPEEWWTQQLLRVGEVEKLRFMFSRSLRYEVRLNKRNSELVHYFT